MTMVEKEVISIQKEIQKLEKSLERNTGFYNKNHELCIKLECDWTQPEYRSHIDSGDITEKQGAAWFKRYGYEREIEDIMRRIENANKRLSKRIDKLNGIQEQEKFEEYIASKEVKWLKKSAEECQEEYDKWLEQFKAECLEDGIKIDKATGNYITGFDAEDRRFTIDLNNGWTERSFHCYTLRINGETIFTSGTFTTAYRYIMK